MLSSFYVTKCPPGIAAGAEDLTATSDYGVQNVDENEFEVEQEFDAEGNLRPLDYYFPRD